MALRKFWINSVKNIVNNSKIDLLKGVAEGNDISEEIKREANDYLEFQKDR